VGSTPEQQALLADSVGLAVLVVLETLAPTKRVAFVLHDIFDLPFDEIAFIVDAPRPPHGSSPAAHDAEYRERPGFRCRSHPPASGRRRPPGCLTRR
jgi:RNA polymerase sigma-70 factor (ECF subfamily)